MRSFDIAAGSPWNAGASDRHRRWNGQREMASFWHVYNPGIPDEYGLPQRTAGRTDPPVCAATIRTELLTPEEAQRHEAAWRGLGARALEPNLFCEPEFVLCAANHLVRRRPPRLLFIFDDRDKASPSLIAVAPLLMPAMAFGEARIWATEHMMRTTPLIDRARADIAIGSMLDALRGKPGRATALSLPRLAEGSAFAQAVRRAAAIGGRRILGVEARQRPIARSACSDAPPGTRIAVARKQRAVREAVEEFLALEASATLERGGEALLMSPAASAFLRVITRSLARTRRCRIELVIEAGRPVGADIILRCGGADLLWKTARSRPRIPNGERQTAEVDWLVATKPGRSAAMLALAGRDRLGSRIRDMLREATVAR
jgi:hypothetical protein